MDNISFIFVIVSELESLFIYKLTDSGKKNQSHSLLSVAVRNSIIKSNLGEKRNYLIL